MAYSDQSYAQALQNAQQILGSSIQAPQAPNTSGQNMLGNQQAMQRLMGILAPIFNNVSGNANAAVGATINPPAVAANNTTPPAPPTQQKTAAPSKVAQIAALNQVPGNLIAGGVQGTGETSSFYNSPNGMNPNPFGLTGLAPWTPAPLFNTNDSGQSSFFYNSPNGSNPNPGGGGVSFYNPNGSVGNTPSGW